MEHLISSLAALIGLEPASWTWSCFAEYLIFFLQIFFLFKKFSLIISIFVFLPMYLGEIAEKFHIYNFGIFICYFSMINLLTHFIMHTSSLSFNLWSSNKNSIKLIKIWQFLKNYEKKKSVIASINQYKAIQLQQQMKRKQCLHKKSSSIGAVTSRSC